MRPRDCDRVTDGVAGGAVPGALYPVVVIVVTTFTKFVVVVRANAAADREFRRFVVGLAGTQQHWPTKHDDNEPFLVVVEEEEEEEDDDEPGTTTSCGCWIGSRLLFPPQPSDLDRCFLRKGLAGADTTG